MRIGLTFWEIESGGSFILRVIRRRSSHQEGATTMAKHAKKSDQLRLVDVPKTAIVEISLPLLEALAKIEASFFDLCTDTGQQVLAGSPM